MRRSCCARTGLPCSSSWRAGFGPIAPAIDLLTGQGYAGWLLAGRRWIALDGFDLVAHQARTEHLVHRGLLRRAFVPHRERYINSVLFLPDGRVPGTA